MSDENNTGATTLSYKDKLAIPSYTVRQAKDTIKTTIINTIKGWNDGKDLKKVTFHLIGDAGIGKTQICKQIAEELSKETGIDFGTRVIVCPVMTRDDFLVPFPEKDGKSFKMLYSDFVPLEEGSYGIFVIDEYSRGDKKLQQMLWPVQNEQKIHTHEFPKGWFVVATDNPDNEFYDMDAMDDPAGIRRMNHMYVNMSPKDFVDYAISTDFHKLVIGFIQANPSLLYDQDAMKQGKVFANPGSYEKVSDILRGYGDHEDIKKNQSNIEKLIGGYLNTNIATAFMEYFNNIKIVRPEDVVFKYEEVKSEIRAWCDNLDYARLSELINGFGIYLATSKPKLTEHQHYENVANFLCDIPPDTAIIWLKGVFAYDQSSEEYDYVTKLHLKMFSDCPRYKPEFFDKLVKIREENDKKRQEAEKKSE